MSSPSEIIWSPLAEQTYLNTLKYILSECTIKEALAFDGKVESLLSKLRTYKKLCPSSAKQKQYRRCVISEQTSLVYKLNKDSIELVAFIDNRSNHGY